MITTGIKYGFFSHRYRAATERSGCVEIQHQYLRPKRSADGRSYDERHKNRGSLLSRSLAVSLLKNTELAYLSTARLILKAKFDSLSFDCAINIQSK